MPSLGSQPKLSTADYNILKILLKQVIPLKPKFWVPIRILSQRGISIEHPQQKFLRRMDKKMILKLSSNTHNICFPWSHLCIGDTGNHGEDHVLTELLSFVWVNDHCSPVRLQHLSLHLNEPFVSRNDREVDVLREPLMHLTNLK